MQISGWSLFCILVRNILVIFENWSQYIWNRSWRSLNKWKDFVATKGGWEVVTLQIAININGHRGYPRKCPAEQNIQEHIWSRVWSGTEIIIQTWAVHTTLQIFGNPLKILEQIHSVLGKLVAQNFQRPIFLARALTWSITTALSLSFDCFGVENCHWVVDHFGVVHHPCVRGFHCFPPCADQTLTSVAQYWFSTPESQHCSQRLLLILNPMILRQKAEKKKTR